MSRVFVACRRSNHRASKSRRAGRCNANPLLAFALILIAFIHVCIYTSLKQSYRVDINSDSLRWLTPSQQNRRSEARLDLDRALESIPDPGATDPSETAPSAVMDFLSHEAHALRQRYIRNASFILKSTVRRFAFDRYNYYPPPRTAVRPRFPASVTNRSWAPDLYRCVFTTVVTTRRQLGHYAMLIESALRLSDVFRLARQYPHLYLHEADLPKSHAAHILRHVPHAVFRDVSSVFRAPYWTPSESSWAPRPAMCLFESNVCI